MKSVVTKLSREILFALAVSVVAVSGLVSAVDAAGTRQGTIKVAFLRHFLDFVEWPQAVSDDFRIAIVGADPFGPALDELAESAGTGRRVSVYRVAAGERVPDCHMVFISRSESERLPELLAEVGGGSVLTVSDIDRFAESGGMIQLRTWRNATELYINWGRAKTAGLHVSSRLLELAKAVIH